MDKESSYNLYLLQNVRFSHEPSGIVFQSDDRYRYLYSANGIFHHFRVCGKTVLADSKKKTALAYVIPRKGSKNYYHSLVDIIPSIYGYSMLGLDCDLVVSHELSPIEKYFIDQLGINREKIIDTRVQNIEIEKAIVPHASTFRQTFFSYCRNVAQRIKSDATSIIGCSEESNNNRFLYISRSRSCNRPMINEKEVERLLASIGFRIVHMEDIDLVSQIKIANEANFIVGAHGAGLANLVFSSSECRILELIPRKYLTPLFCQLASDCGVEYDVLIGDMIGEHIGNQVDFKWSIDIEKLENAIGKLLSMT